MRFRPTKRQRAIDLNLARDFLAAASENPRRHEAPRAAVPAKRAAPQPSGKPLESDIQKGILALLATHPKVVFAGRFNRGSVMDDKRYVRFNTVPGFPDIHGLLKGGKALYIEVKRSRTSPVTLEQSSFNIMASNAGAIAIVAWSIEQVTEALKNA